MNVTLPIPDELAARFGSEAELGRRVVEALALEEYRAARLTRSELRQVLGFATSGELDGFLRDHGVAEDISADGSGDLDQNADRQAAADDLVARFRAFAANHALDGLAIKDLISEGRR
ncbi:MAG: hypothetical protein JO264_07795 [Acidisphaera sp.]|nr:hypothetical protein [Acidisphaera sp.]